MSKLYIFGTGGQSKIVTDMAESCNIKIGGYIAEEDISEFLGYKAYKKVEDIPNYIDQVYFIAIGNNRDRKKVALKNSNLTFINIIHPSAIISKMAKLGIGNLVMPNTVVNAYAEIGNHCILNTASVVEHECKVANYCHISVNSTIAGTVYMGEGVFVGAGAVIKNNLVISDNVTIGAGAAVVKDISEKGVYVGVPARILIDEK